MADPSSRPLGPWMKLYADVIERKAHYTDRQFRALIEAYVAMLRGRGTLPPAKALRASLGVEEFDFLVEEGDLIVDGNAVTVCGWARYQSPQDPTNAERQRRYRERHSERGDAVDNGSNTVTVTEPVTEVPSSSVSSSRPTTQNGATPHARTRGKLPEPRLSKEQFEAWQAFDREEWGPFRAASLDRGFLSPPGERQRAMLWPIVDARPHSAARWLREAPGTSYRAAIEYVLAKWQGLADKATALEAEEDALVVPHEEAKEALTRLGAVLSSSTRSDHSLTGDESPGRESPAGGLEANSFARPEVPGESGPDRAEALDGRER